MGSWYTENHDNIVVSTRIRLARNITGLPFPYGMSELQRTELKNTVKKAITDNKLQFCDNLKYIDMENIPENEINAMVERHIISPEFAKNISGKAIILSADESISIMVGEEDHIRIQVILSGLQLEKAYETAQQIDDFLNEKLHFAFDNELGYLTECPTNLGTGLRSSVMLHLPFCELTGQINGITETVNKIGFTVRGIYGEGSKSVAGLYQISNQITLGINEKNAIDNLSLITAQLMEKENNCSLKVERISLEDKVFRALGILKNCRLLDTNEMMNLLSLINLGQRMGIIKEEYKPISLLIEAQPFMLMRRFGDLIPAERDVKRAEFVREHFNKHL